MANNGRCAVPVMAAAGAALFLAGADPAMAGPTQAFSVSTGGTATESLNFSLFDPSLGTLTGVQFSLSNSSPTETSTMSISGGEGSGSGHMSVNFVVNGPGSGGPTSVTLFSGAGSASSACTTGAFGDCTSSGNSSTTPPVLISPDDVTNASDLASYEGIGTFSVQVALAGLATFTDTCNPKPSFKLTCTPGGSAAWTGDVSVDFTYTANVVATPEPGSLMLFASGLALLGGVPRLLRRARF